MLAGVSGGLSFRMSNGKKSEGKVGGEGLGEVNGEMVETQARDLQRLEFGRMLVSALGFGMGVVGIWGDGA